MSFLAPLVARGVVAEQLIKPSFKKGQTVSVEIFGYDFIGLGVKLLVFALLAIALDKLHFAISGTFNVAVTIARVFGINIPSEEPDFMKQLFSEEGFGGFKYWDLIKIIIIALVAFEMIRYIDSNKKLGGEASPITLAVFGLLIFGLASFTFPGLIAMIKSRGSFGGLQ